MPRRRISDRIGSAARADDSDATSALVKCYVDEDGRRQVLQLLRRHECVTSAVLPVELRSALRRRVYERTHLISPEERFQVAMARQ